MFERFDRIRIVSLPHRTDRRADMRRELTKLGLAGDPRVEFFDALRPDNAGFFRNCGQHGCYLSHLAIIKEAAEARESVLVLQDDCEFIPGKRPAKCDILWGGWLEASDPGDLPNSDIIGAQCIGFSAKAAENASVYLSALLDPEFPPDPRASKDATFNPAKRPGIDGACVWFIRAHPELKTVFARLSTQRASRSDIADPRFFDRVPIVREAATAARSIKRLLTA